MKLEFLWVGKTKNRELSRLEDEYLKRIKHFFPIETKTVRELKRSDPRRRAAVEEKEARLLEAKLSKNAFLVVLDQRGQQFSSLELAAFMRRLQESRCSTASFIIGGFDGVPERIRKKANRTLSLSRMTFAHEMARVILLEQIYRAATILQGTPYHR